MNTNLGMYIEQMVDRTILYYQTNNIGLIEKRQIPIKIIKHINESTIIAKLVAKAKVDYFGYIKNKYFEMECKQTKHEYFDINLIKNHQLNYLNFITTQNMCAYVLVYFEKYDEFIAISYDNLMKAKTDAKKKILPFNKMVEYGIKIEVKYPGILNLEKLF